MMFFTTQLINHTFPPQHIITTKCFFPKQTRCNNVLTQHNNNNMLVSIEKQKSQFSPIISMRCCLFANNKIFSVQKESYGLFLFFLTKTMICWFPSKKNNTWIFLAAMIIMQAGNALVLHNAGSIQRFTHIEFRSWQSPRLWHGLTSFVSDSLWQQQRRQHSQNNAHTTCSCAVHIQISATNWLKFVLLWLLVSPKEVQRTLASAQPSDVLLFARLSRPTTSLYVPSHCFAHALWSSCPGRTDGCGFVSNFVSLQQK